MEKTIQEKKIILFRNGFCFKKHTSSKELLHIGHWACVLSIERIRHSRQNTCPQGVVTGNHSKL